MIPKRIISMWIGGPMPEVLNEYVASHKQPGWEHLWVNNDNVHRFIHSRYLDEALDSGNYGKASDYLRIVLLEKFGGIYLDADTKIIKPLDRFLEHQVFCCREPNNFVANGIIGAEQGHPMMTHYRGLIERNFRGSGELVFQPGMFLWTELVNWSKYSKDVTVYPSEWFLPYDHQTDSINITENTHTYHLYLKSWVDKSQPP